MTNRELIEQLRIIQRASWSQLLETPDLALAKRVYEACKEAADALEALEMVGKSRDG